MKTEWGWRNPDWKWQSTWRSEFNWQRLKLSKSMQTALKALISNKDSLESVSSRTLSALKDRNLLNSSGLLTKPGVVAGRSLLPTRKQCEALCIPIENVDLPRKYDDPAVDGMYYLKTQGFFCTYSEGAVLRKILFCLYFHRLSSLTKEGWKYFMDGMGTMPLAIGLGVFDFEDYVKDFSTIEDDILQTVSEVTRDEFLTNYRRLFKKGFCWLGADEYFTGRLFDLLGKDRLTRIVKTLFRDPYAFSQGWPDLTAITQDEVQFIEVKAKDKLTVSQLITIPEMIGAADISVKVLQIKRI
jgi:hypothetical protein